MYFVFNIGPTSSISSKAGKVYFFQHKGFFLKYRLLKRFFKSKIDKEIAEIGIYFGKNKIPLTSHPSHQISSSHNSDK